MLGERELRKSGYFSSSGVMVLAKISDLVPITTEEILRSIFENAQENTQEDTQVLVTHHAVQRFLDWRRGGSAKHMEEKGAENFLVQMVREGEIMRPLPGGAHEVRFRGLSAVVKFEKSRCVVLTFNGDKNWRAWWRKQRRRERVGAKVLAAL